MNQPLPPPTSPRVRWWPVALLIGCLIPLLGVSCSRQSEPPESTSLPSPRPNIILVYLDDADYDMFTHANKGHERFPAIMNRVAKQGMTFSNMHVTTPLCGPSRACLYRGQYAHNTGIRFNDEIESQSGVVLSNFQHYQRQGFADDDLPVWMQELGYRTLFVGKHIHVGSRNLGKVKPPSGWDEFAHYLGNRYYQTHYCRLQEHGFRFAQIPEGVYRTRHECAVALQLLDEHHTRHPQKPFFLNLNPFAPHLGSRLDHSMIDTEHENLWKDLQPPPIESFDEGDNSDKRGGYAMLKKLNPIQFKFTEKYFRDRQLAVRSVDDAIAQILDALTAEQLANTYVLVTSDNGYSNGHHRLIGKGTPSDRSTHVPLMICGPGIKPQTGSAALLGQIDLAPTIVELAGGVPPQAIDGRSFAPLLTPDAEPTCTPREALLIENWEPCGGGDWGSVALRLPQAVYTEWANGDRDYFDLSPTADPLQLTNTWDALSHARQLELSKQLRALRGHGIANQTCKTGRNCTTHTAIGILRDGDTVDGFAESGFGVAQVFLRLQDSNGLFFNGRTWQKQPFELAPNIENPDGLITFWNLPVSFSADQQPTGTLSTSAWTVDLKGNVSPASKRRFEYVPSREL